MRAGGGPRQFMSRSLQTPKGKPYTQRGSNLLAEPEAGGASALNTGAGSTDQRFPHHPHQGLPRWLVGKASTCPGRRRGFDPWVGKIPWRRKWQSTPVFLPGPSHGQRSLLVYSHGAAKSRTCLSTSTTTLTRPFPMHRPRRKGATFLFLLGLPHPSASFATQPTLGIQELCHRDIFTLLSH